MSPVKPKPKTLTGSRDAKRAAAVVLEVLSGVMGPSEGSETLGTSLNRYYELETRALQGLVTALEPRPKGRQRTREDEILTLEKEKKKLERELTRAQTLVRAAQRTIGLPSKTSRKSAKTRSKPKTRRVHRGRKAVARLRAPSENGVGSGEGPTAASS
jgi:hypothetical protein